MKASESTVVDEPRRGRDAKGRFVPAVKEATPVQEIQQPTAQVPALRQERRLDAYEQTPEQFAASLEIHREKRRALLDYVASDLIAGVDYGLIHRKIKLDNDRRMDCSYDGQTSIRNDAGKLILCPDCGAKYSLWKPGSEKINGHMDVVPLFNVDEETMAALELRGASVAYRCQLVSLRTGQVLAEGRGAATLDKKSPRANTTIKMAEKSSMIDGTLRLAGLSALFTQDIEDMSPAQLRAYRGQGNGKPSGRGAGSRRASPSAPPGTDPAPADPDAPTCAQCGLAMKKRKSKKTGWFFWGCSGFPKCRHIVPIPNQKGNGKPKPKEGDFDAMSISIDQKNRIADLGGQLGLTREDGIELLKKYRVKGLSDLTAAQGDEIIKDLEAEVEKNEMNQAGAEE